MTSRLLLVRYSNANTSDVQPDPSSLVSDVPGFNSKIILHYAAISGGFKHLPSSIGIVSYKLKSYGIAKFAPHSSIPIGENEFDQTRPREVEDLAGLSADKVSASEAGHGDPTPGEAHAHEPSYSAATSNANIITWIDDDIDDTDYKNMPDYDPDQEESVYESTPEPDESSSTHVPLQSIDGYLKIYDSDANTSSTSEESLGPYLLLLFIPNASIASSEASDSTHGTFLHYIKRYPCMTSLPFYIRTLAFASGETSTERSYLIVQSFSSLERRPVEWLALKRKEAKHWWRKEERGARGVRAGFFVLTERRMLEHESVEHE